MLIDGILFNADNRLVGSATGDLSLYGAQHEPGIMLRPVSPDAAPGAPPADPILALGSSVVPAPANVPQSVALEGAEAVPIAPAGAGAFQFAAPSVPPSALDAAGQQGAVPMSAGFAPDAMGAGAIFVPAQVLVTVPAPQTHDDDAQPHVDAGSAALPESYVPHAEASAPIAAVAESAGDLFAASAPVATLAAAALDASDDILSTTVGALEDTLHGLAGADPAGGVATLVNLVSVSDLFDLHPVDASLPDGDAATGLGLVDTLADADLPIADPLLGMGDHHDGAGSGLDHILDHPLGL